MAKLFSTLREKNKKNIKELKKKSIHLAAKFKIGGLSMIELMRCPICGKEPKVIRDWAYESNGYGAWCTIQCKPFMQKPHLKIEEGKSTWDRALQYLVERWNCLADEVKKNNDLLK